MDDSPGLFSSIGNWLGLNSNSPATQQATPGQVQQPSDEANYRKMMLAQSLMGGNSAGGNPQSFAGGLAQGINPVMHAMMMRQLMSPQIPAQPTAPGQIAQQPDPSAGMTPFMLGGQPQS